MAGTYLILSILAERVNEIMTVYQLDQYLLNDNKNETVFALFGIYSEKEKYEHN